jgi:uncharacterized Zn finger protein
MDSNLGIEALRAAWLDAANLDEQRRICTELQLQLWQDVPYILMGEYWQSTAYRKDLLDVLPGCFSVFWVFATPEFGSHGRSRKRGNLRLA